MEIVAPLALLAAGFLTGWVLGYSRGVQAPPAPAPPLAYLAHLTPERRPGCAPAAPFLIIRADPGAPVEYQR